MRSAMVVVVMLLTTVVAAPQAGSTLAASGTQHAMLVWQNDTGIWVLSGSEPSQASPEEAADSCYNSFEVTVGGLSATTFAKCTWPSPPVDVWNRSQHSWSNAPPEQLAPGETLQITSTVSTEGTYRSNGLSGGGSSWVRIDLVPGGGPYPGAVWAGVYEGEPANSAVSEFSIPSGSDGSLMLVSLSFQGPGGSGATTYTYQWQGPDGTVAPPLATTGPPATVTTPGIDAEPEEPEPCTAEVQDSGVRFSSFRGEVEVFPESDPEDLSFARLNLVLNVCDHVRTADESSAILQFLDLSTFVLGPNSEIALGPVPQGRSNLAVVAGKIWVNIKRMAAGESLDVLTERSVTGVEGTIFVVETSDVADVIKVIDGEVEVTSLATGVTERVSIGQMVSVTNDGLVETTTFDVAAESRLWGQDLPAADGGGSSRTFIAIGVAVVVAVVGGWFALTRKRNRGATSPDAPTPSVSKATSPQPPDWYPDPGGMHEFRYWDGSAWTANVSDSGQTTTDPP